MRPNEKGGTGALWYIDKTFTIASTQDQFIATSTIQERTEQPMTTQPSTPQVPLRFLSVCSGMEAASVAWEPLGWKAVGFSEIEPFPCAVLAHRFPNTPNYGSLTEYQSWPLGPDSIDLLVGGTPCQSFSVAGLRKGLADPRGNLALVFLGLADKLKPRWIVWENVPGVLSSDGGRDFGSFLGALEQLGYGWSYRVLDAQYFGVPQRRRRVFVVASLGGRDAAASVLLKPESVCWHPAPRRKKGQATAADAGAGVEAGLPRTVGTLCADAHPGAYSGQDAYTGRLIPCPDNDSVGTLCARDFKGVGNQFVQEGKCIPMKTTKAFILDSFTSNSMKSDNPQSGCREVDATKCLDTSCLNPSCNQGGVMITQPIIPIHDQATRFAGKHGDKQDGKGNGLGIGQPGDPMNTLTQGDKHAVYTPPMAVRRLTPMECERLQGFPDNWSQIPWKGKPADQCPDGPRYKCAGNSMAVPVMRWIGEQIARVELSTQQPK